MDVRHRRQENESGYPRTLDFLLLRRSRSASLRDHGGTSHHLRLRRQRIDALRPDPDANNDLRLGRGQSTAERHIAQRSDFLKRLSL